MSEERPRKRRTLTTQERELWAYVTRHIEPPASAKKAVTPRVHPVMRLSSIAGSAAPPKPDPAPPRIYEVPSYVPPMSAPAISQPRAALPPIAPIERRLKQRVARGVDDIDAAIDLHGMRQAEAHMALRAFLMRSQAEGARLVLVVTGKGAGPQPGESERGVLRRAVPHWLRDSEWRHLIIGFEEAARGHGGAGALYVRIRRGRAP